MSVVPMHPGQWAVSFTDECFDYRNSLADNVEGLRYRNSGWDYRGVQVLVVREVGRVMPRTYECGARRHHREMVVAAANSQTQAEAIRSKLQRIGDEADDEIERKVSALAAPIRQRVRAKALAKLHSALPHIFGDKQ